MQTLKKMSDEDKNGGNDMNDCYKDCLSCANSFSEPSQDENESDILHCMEKDGQVVDENDCCELYN